MAEPTVLRVRPRGLVLRGRVWPGADGPSLPSGVVIVDGTGHLAAFGPAESVPVPSDLPRHGGDDTWIGPGLVDAHVHLMFGSPGDMVRGGVVALRDLGARADQALSWRMSSAGPVVAVAGPIVTTPGGYPTTSWGTDRVGVGVGESNAAAVTSDLARAGVDVIKIALEPASGLPVPSLQVVGAVVAAAHDRGLAVTAHALTAGMVDRAIAAGVDELAHIPVEPLPAALVERLVAAGVTVVSTLHALTAYPDSAVRDNAAALVAAGVPVVYGTDLGNEGTRAGAEPRELELLAAAGLGRIGALRAATEGAASVAGLRQRRGLGRLAIGQPAALVALRGDPIDDPQCWRDPLAVAVGDRVWLPQGGGERIEITGTAPVAGGEHVEVNAPAPAPLGIDDRNRPGTSDVDTAPAPPGTLDLLRTLLVRFRADVVVALIVIAGSVLAGALVGVAWEAIASPARVLVVNGGARFADPEQQKWISADGWLGILGAMAGVIVATLAYLRVRDRGVAMTIGLAAGGLGGAYLASWVGRALGPSPVDPSLADGTAVNGPLAVHAPAVLYAWPIAALAVVLALTAGFGRPPVRSTPESHWSDARDRVG